MMMRQHSIDNEQTPAIFWNKQPINLSKTHQKNPPKNKKEQKYNANGAYNSVSAFEQEPNKNQTKSNQWNKQTPSNSDSNITSKQTPQKKTPKHRIHKYKNKKEARECIHTSFFNSVISWHTAMKTVIVLLNTSFSVRTRSIQGIGLNTKPPSKNKQKQAKPKSIK